MKASQRIFKDLLNIATLFNTALAQKMKNRERQNLYNSDVIGVKNEQTSNENAFKVRRGKIGGFKDYLSTQEIEAIDSIIKKNLNHEFGY